MGASDWNYSLPYQPDINQALQRLRQLVFEKKEFYQRQRLPVPTSIVQLQELNGEEGTHCILDIESVSAVRGSEMASPLAAHELLDLFGMLQPSRAMVAEQERAHTLWHYRGRWEALYIVIYEDGQPSEIFFRGFSGD